LPVGTVGGLLRPHLLQQIGGGRRDTSDFGSVDLVAGQGVRVEGQLVLAPALNLVALDEARRILAVVALDWLERLVRDTVRQQLRRRADQPIAVLNVSVEEAE